jgi:hypothetical protein
MNSRKSIDCRGLFGSTCSLSLSGDEEEVFAGAIDHAVHYHGLINSEKLREIIRRNMRPEKLSSKIIGDASPSISNSISNKSAIQAPGYFGKEFEKMRASHR